MKCGCFFFFFSLILQIWYVEVRRSRSISDRSLGLRDNESRLYIKWVGAQYFLQDCMCAQRRLRSACAYTQAYQFSFFFWRRFGSFAAHIVLCEDSGQTTNVQADLSPRWAYMQFQNKCCAPGSNCDQTSYLSGKVCRVTRKQLSSFYKWMWNEQVQTIRCIYTESNQDFSYRSIYSVASIESISGRRRSWSDYAGLS